MLVKDLNPVYIYAAIADFIALIVGVGIITVTDVQQDLVLKFIAAIILLTTGVAVPAAKVNDDRIEKAFYTHAKPDEVVKL